MLNHEVSTHYTDGSFRIYDWYDKEDGWTATKEWLLETYGPDIQQYTTFAISATQ